MKYIITDKCINCGSCEPLCPEDAIYDICDDTYKLDSSKCTGCGLCAEVCFVNAIIKVGVL